MEYSLINPPFILNFDKMTKAELKKYKEWFLHILPERIDILTKYVHSTPGFEGWKADYSPDSLNILGEWFAKKVETRSTTKEEQEKQLSYGTLLKTYSEWELTSKTYSLCADIGMYLAEVFLKKYSWLKWEQQLTSRKCIDYGTLVLSGAAKYADLNPIRLIIVFASKLVSRCVTGVELYEIFIVREKLFLSSVNK